MRIIFGGLQWRGECRAADGKAAQWPALIYTRTQYGCVAPWRRVTGLEVGPDIFGAFGSEIHGGGMASSRIARHYEADGGALGDPGAAPNLSHAPGAGARTPRFGTGCASIDPSADDSLLFDGDGGRIRVKLSAASFLSLVRRPTPAIRSLRSAA